MSKVIEPAPFLSEFDREYLIARGKNPEDYIVPEDPDNPDDDVPPYTEWLVPALEREIAERNEERDEADQIRPATGKKKDLIDALEADDATAEGDDDEDEA